MGLPWVGRTFNLKAACRQFGVGEEDTNSLKIALKVGSGAVRAPLMSWPYRFGAMGSVVVFLRVAASLAFFDTNGSHMCWLSFLKASLR